MDYEYDIFISYRRAAPMRPWVCNQFHPRLAEWLTESLPTAPRVFIDEQIETGESWPDALRRALAHSRLLVPVLSPPYFNSDWCRAELNTMYERERLLGLRTKDNLGGLILPVSFHDGQHFPDHVREMKPEPFAEWAYGPPYFEDSAHHVRFLRAIKRFAEKLAERLPNVPPWDADWPSHMPSTAPIRFDAPLPRLT